MQRTLKNMSEELMPIGKHPKRWWNLCMWEVEVKKLNEFLLSNAFHVQSIEVLGPFTTWNLCEYLVILTLDIVQKSLWLVQCFFCLIFWAIFPNYIFENVYNNLVYKFFMSF